VTKAIWLWWPLTVLTALASYAASATLSARWLNAAPPGCALLAAAAVHAVWIVSTVQRRNFALRGAAWLVCLSLTADGIYLLTARPGGLPAFALELILLLAAFTAAPPLPLSERLANWRRAREAAMAQLALTDGLLPWTTAFFHRLIGNRADPHSASARLDRAQILAELEDAEGLAAAQRRRVP
jgi:hypothetical protein